MVARWGQWEGKTYVLRDLDEGEGVLGGLGWQGPGAEGRRDGGQTGGRHNFSLRNRAHKQAKEKKKAVRLEGGRVLCVCVW